MIAGIKKLYESKKKLQASNLKIEIIGEIQCSNNQTGHSNKVPLPRDLRVSI